MGFDRDHGNVGTKILKKKTTTFIPLARELLFVHFLRCSGTETISQIRWHLLSSISNDDSHGGCCEGVAAATTFAARI